MIAVAGAAGLCVALPASAQTSVSVYGLVDLAVEYSSQGAGSLVRLQSGSYQGSRLGFVGKEDLGGGTSAIFRLENGFTADAGTLGQGGRLFGRQAYVGLQNTSLGTLTLGRQYSPLYTALVQQDAFNYTMVGGLPALTVTKADGTTGVLLGTWEANGRVDNTIVYESPVIAGFSARVMYGLGEVAGSQAAGRVTGIHARYNLHGIDLNASYTSAHDPLNIGARTARTLGGSYDFGPVQLFLGFVENSSDFTSTAGARSPRSEIDIYNVGARMPLTPALTLTGQVDRIRDRSDNVTASKDATAISIGGEYSLSKRTLLYSSVGTVGNQNGSRYSWGSGTALGGPEVGNSRAKTANVGIKHTF